MMAKVSDTMYLVVSRCILMYMNGTHRNTCTIHARYMQDTWDTYRIGNYTKTYRKPHVTRVRPRPPKGVATTSNTRHKKGNETSQSTPVGKAGFEVWVLTKGGLVSVHHCRLYRTVVHAHHLGRYAEPSGACVYRYGPVTKSKLS